MHRQTQTVQVLHCRRKATGKGKAGRSGPSGTGNRRQGNPRPRARRQPADACVLRRIDAGSRGRALQQWIGGVHADVKGLCFFDRAACVCVPAFRPRRACVAALPDLFLVFILTRSIGRSTAAATCDPSMRVIPCCLRRQTDSGQMQRREWKYLDRPDGDVLQSLGVVDTQRRWWPC